MSDRRLPLMARAAELARSGKFKTVATIRAQLAGEGYENVLSHLGGKKSKDDLNALIRAARDGDT